MAWPILNEQRFANINQALLLDAGAKLNLAKTTAKRLLDNLRGRIVQAAEALYAEVEAENAGLVAQRPELAATLAGESRCLRAIVHVVIKDMAAKLM